MAKTPKVEENSFLSRWSRRKTGLEEKAENEAAPLAAAKEAQAAETSRQEEENRAEAEAVDLETLTYESDYNLFLKPGVPPELRSQALQRLWRSNPLLANVDGLNDYDEDFTTPAGAAAAVVKTAWKVGKGFLDDEDKEASKEEAETEAEAEPEPLKRKPTKPASLRASEVRAAPLAEPEVESDDSTAERPQEVSAPLAQPQRVGLRARLDLDAFGDSENKDTT